MEERYCKRNEYGEVEEEPEEVFSRVAKNIAKAEEKYGNDVKEYEEKFNEIMEELKFIPNTPTLANAGTPLQQLAACFKLSVKDSMDDIFQKLKEMALISKSGGGTGLTFSQLRPKGDLVSSTRRPSTGPLSFMKIYDSAVNEIKQGGIRRGALITVMNVTHPDIIEFIEAKQHDGDLNNMNMSVAVTDEFMKAVKEDKEYDLINPRNGEKWDSVKAKKVWNKMTSEAWNNGEPGIIFIDEVNEDDPTDEWINGCNPCSEQFLPDYGSCNLGHINLRRFVEDGEIDLNEMERVIRLGVRFLDDVIDMSDYPLEEITEKAEEERRIGLGIMGWHDMLIELDIPYDSVEARDLAEDLGGLIKLIAEDESQILADERGEVIDGRRNTTLTTIAPTGTTSIVGNSSSGLEPHFSREYKRTTESGKVMEFELDSDVKTAMDIEPIDHLKMQAAWQDNIDSGISKTINLPYSATVEDVREIYMKAYELGCKSVTIYRNDSRDEQVLECDCESCEI